ncbi:Sodium-dependent neutral amino acid transporter B(0)AT2 [Microtus ochrogaster]|uniref:Sodium-dependent neutral amino acid transporter B(0)AT2 n=1 Tax=Microtus ochrogaster TaxID=79684 RepID=A0A8J6GW97_MICOH|nr:Sodium-dependent neutral amino acid transporter B(0)AT2 [Microtus ochrogaster]
MRFSSSLVRRCLESQNILYHLLFSSYASRSVNNLVDLIIKGVLSQADWPPQGIIHKPPVEYMDWISQLHSKLQADVVHFSPPCSILVQKEKIYVVFLFDDHLVPMVLVVIVVLQNLSLAFVYGISRFRAEMFYQLGRLVWAPFTFLWTYVTLPALLVLLAIYFLNLYHRKTLYYISWNESMSQEVKQPYQKIILGWVTFLSVLAPLPIPVYPLQH